MSEIPRHTNEVTFDTSQEVELKAEIERAIYDVAIATETLVKAEKKLDMLVIQLGEIRLKRLRDSS